MSEPQVPAEPASCSLLGNGRVLTVDISEVRHHERVTDQEVPA